MKKNNNCTTHYSNIDYGKILNKESKLISNEIRYHEIIKEIDTLRYKSVDLLYHIYIVLSSITPMYFIGYFYSNVMCGILTILTLYYIYNDKKIKYLETELYFINKDNDNLN